LINAIYLSSWGIGAGEIISALAGICCLLLIFIGKGQIKIIKEQSEKIKDLETWQAVEKAKEEERERLHTQSANKMLKELSSSINELEKKVK
tara:strand:- start:279 stop:554 length:276 start_codon:yes stop_codon:yes gene_type:complete